MKTGLLQMFEPTDEALVWRGGGAAGLVITDTSGRIHRATGTASGLLDAPWGLDGHLFLAFFAPEYRDIIFEALRAGGNAPGPILVRRAGEKPFALELRFEPAGENVRILILDRAADEQLIKELREEAAAAKRQANASSDLLADLSHEMRTPLNAVIGFAEAMQNETFGPLGHSKYVEYADHIRSSGGHLMELISAILDLARFDAGRTSLKREMMNLGAVASECVAMVTKAAEDAGLKLTLSVEDNLPESWLDPRAVRQVMINLLANAVKFTSDGGIDVSITRDRDTLVAVVNDTGVGMNQEELARLGGRFTSVSSDGVRGANGAGLGLALCFALAEAHDGELKLDSAPGEGVSARLSLPIAAAPARPVRVDDQPTDEIIVHSQLDRIAEYKRELAAKKSAA